jgi:hypothetical protein
MRAHSDIRVPLARLPCRDQGGLIAAPLGTPASLSLLPGCRRRAAEREPTTPTCLRCSQGVFS